MLQSTWGPHVCPSQGEHTQLPAAAPVDRGHQETAQATFMATQSNALLEQNTQSQNAYSEWWGLAGD